MKGEPPLLPSNRGVNKSCVFLAVSGRITIIFETKRQN